MAGKLLRLAEVADRLGCSREHVRRLAKRGELTPAEGVRPLSFPWPAVRGEWDAYRLRRDSPGPPRSDVVARKLEAAARLAELRLEAELAELIPVEVDRAIRAELVGELRRRLRALPKRWRRELVGLRSVRSAATRLEGLTHELLTELADLGSELWAAERRRRPSSGKIDACDPAARQLEAEARLAELRVARAEGLVVELEEHVAWLAALLEDLRRVLVVVPGSWASYLVGLRTQRQAISRAGNLVDELLDAVPGLRSS